MEGKMLADINYSRKGRDINIDFVLLGRLSYAFGGQRWSKFASISEFFSDIHIL
jgi:hypothetical protein